MTTDTMYLVIQPRNEEEITRELNEDELLDCDIYAADLICVVLAGTLRKCFACLIGSG